MQVMLTGTPLGADDATAAVRQALERAGAALGDTPGRRVMTLRLDVPRTVTDGDVLAAAIGDELEHGLRRALGGR
jgi:hypothetical protein